MDQVFEALPPRAEVLIESMRDIGYTTSTALADIVDNSITAGAKTVHVMVNTSDESPAIAVIDDGRGMSRDELREALRPGSRNPRASRDAADLGRFGLGLKTASFSQCRRLIVVSRKDGETTAASWDLDVIATKGDWIIEWIGVPESLRWFEMLPQTGTMVLWEKLDRPAGGDAGKTMTRVAEEARKHLGLVFHRFISPERGERGIRISLNLKSIEAEDPFAEWHPATIRGPEEIIPIPGSQVKISPFTLPHHSKSTPDERRRFEGDLGPVRSQGFYLYRERRLILRGTWFGLMRQTDLTKLSRVRVDISNSTDAEWHIDVRKSSASPPPAVRERLRRIIEPLSGGSKRTYVRRGVRLTEENPLPVWRRSAGTGTIKYDIDPTHPTLVRLAEVIGPLASTELRQALQLISASLPLDALLHDLSERPDEVLTSDLNDEDILAVMRDAWMRLSSNGTKSATVRSLLSGIPPYCNYPALLDQIEEELRVLRP